VKIYIKKYLPLILVVIFFAATLFFYENKIFEIHFVDEEENIILGSYILRGEKLYSDLFSQHQPLGYILSAAVQKVFQPQNIFMLIKRHREVVFLWSFMWSLLLVGRFGIPLLGFTFLFELTKFYLFGNMFLAESLVVYPLIFLSSLFFLSERKMGKFESFFIGVSVGISLLLLLPIWPLVLFLLVILLSFVIKSSPKNILFLIAGCLIVVAFCLPFLSLRDYFYSTFYINLKYSVNDKANNPTFNLLNSFITPFLAFSSKLSATPILYITRILSLILIIGLTFLIKKKKYLFSLLIIIILGLGNLRYIKPDVLYYGGFHRAPWYALLILLTSIVAYKIFSWKKSEYFKALVTIIVIYLIFTTGKFLSKDLFRKRDAANDFYINYSRQFDYGEAVKIMKDSNEKLLVIPDEFLIYWQSGAPHASKYIFFYPWMMEVPGLYKEIENLFAVSPPVYFYCNCEGMKVKPLTKNYLALRKFGSPTQLYVLPQKVEQLSQDKLSALKYYHFEFVDK